MKNINFFLLLLIFLTYSSVNSQWILQYNSDSSTVNEIEFVNNNIGFAVGGDTYSIVKVLFLNTTNGGNSWNDLSNNIPLNYEIFDLSFINSQTGYICGRSGAYILKTTNAGLNWQTINVPYFANQIWNALQFVNENTGYIAGRYGMMAKTLNGGINWILFDTTFRNIYDINFFNENTGFAVDGQGYVQKTTDGGNSWSTIELLDTLSVSYSLQKIAFHNQNIGFIVGATTNNGAVFKTTNSGESWKNIFISQIPFHSVDIYDNIIYVGGQSKILLKSTNSGSTWNQQILSTTNSGIYSIILLSSNTGYLSINHQIYKTTNGGVWITQISSAIPENFELYQNYPNPFNPSTRIKFSVPQREFVNIIIYDISGKIIRTLVNQTLTEGIYETKFDAENFSTGIFFCKMTSRKYTAIKKMIYVK
jgi:photosystem II stability/assembly factor-like uncharacterized protein